MSIDLMFAVLLLLLSDVAFGESNWFVCFLVYTFWPFLLLELFHWCFV